MNENPPEDSPADGTSPFADPGAHAPPAELDYEIIRLIGQGGYGDVYLVRDRAGNHFACKVVYRESFQHERPYEREYEGIQKFEPVSRASESQVRILHVGRRDEAGYFYYIMELADDVRTGGNIESGAYVPKTLRSEIERRKIIPVDECIQLGLSLTDALENLHRHGLIHRDIKPANIIFVNGVPKLADIGLVTDRDVTVSYVGTEGFIPPEGPKTAQADIYSLGKVLYEIATGKDRMEFPELPENFSEHPDWEKLLELSAVIIKACETDPKKRYASAQEFHDDLALLNAGKSVRKKRTAQRRTALLARSCLTLAAAAAIAAGGFYLWRYLATRVRAGNATVTSSKIPWPSAHDIAESEAKLKDDYKTDLVPGAPVQVRQKAALELLERGPASGDPAFEAASLRVAGLLAARAEDISLMTEVCDKMEQRFDINVLPQKVEMLQEAGAHVRTPADRNDLTDACLATGFAAIAIDDYASAANLADLAGNVAATAPDASLARQAAFLSDETDQCSEAFDRITNEWKIFREKPADAKASLAVGKFLCFIKNDWANGLPLLARGSDAALKSVVNTEINGKLEDSRSQLDLGSAWWNLAAASPGEDRVLYETRARYWYQKSVTSAPAADRPALRRKLTPRIDAVPAEAGSVHIVSRVSGTEFLDIYSDQAEWHSSRRGTTGNKINYVNLGDFKGGGLEVVKNCGATWLMPGNVDFSTAKLVTDRNPRGLGSATLQIAADHVRVFLAHPRLGASEMEVTVSFEKRP